MGFKRVSEAVIRRLPRYYRHLTMLETQGVERISSERLARQMNLNASQVRQDFNCFGGFGQQGYGYNVSNLTGEIKRIMGIDRKHTIIIVGAGNIGHALTNFPGFAETGFEVKALFDVNEDLIGTEIKGHPVLDVKDMDEYIRENQIDIGVIAARRSAAAAWSFKETRETLFIKRLHICCLLILYTKSSVASSGEDRILCFCFYTPPCLTTI